MPLLLNKRTLIVVPVVVYISQLHFMSLMIGQKHRDIFIIYCKEL